MIRTRYTLHEFLTQAPVWKRLLCFRTQRGLHDRKTAVMNNPRVGMRSGNRVGTDKEVNVRTLWVIWSSREAYTVDA